MMRAAVDALGDVPLNALMFTAHAARFNSFLRRINPRSHVRIIPLERVGVETVIDLQERIARGECVALMADRPSAGAGERSVSVPFLGSEAAFPEGPFLLASLLECPVYTVWCVRLPNGRYQATVSLFEESFRVPRKDRQAALTTWISKFAAELEAQCLRAPFQWFNFFRFWVHPLSHLEGRHQPHNE